MKITVLSLFCEMFKQFSQTSIVGKAVKKNAIEIELIDFRKYTFDNYKTVDDYPYGGGAGMVLKPEPIARAFDDLNLDSDTPVIYFTPQGKVLKQAMVHKFSFNKHIVMLCGHYKELDQRIRDMFVTTEISIGDYVLSGGELPAMVMIDALARLQDGVINNISSALEDSFADGLLGCPHYTRPPVFRGQKVPEVLMSGNHKLIEEFRREKSYELTKKVRPDLLKDKQNEK